MTDNVERRMATAARKTIRDRNYRRARDRALVRLAHLYPDTYKQLLEMEKLADEKQGKNWISVDGSTALSVGVHTRATGADDFTHTSNKGKNKGNNGGKA
jgi:hemerythrin superfamily protein